MSSSFNEHYEALRKELSQMQQQVAHSKQEIDKGKAEMAAIQSQIQNTVDPAAQAGIQMEIMKAQEIAKRVEGTVRSFISMISDPAIQMQMMADIDNASKSAHAMPGGGMQGIPPQLMAAMPMMMGSMAAVPQQMMPTMQMMMARNPMMQSQMAAAATPRMSKANGMPNGAQMAAAMGMPPNGMGMQQAAMVQQMAAQAQQAMVAQMQAAAMGFPGIPGLMGMHGMGGMPMPPGMANAMGMMGGMPPASAAAAAAMAQLSNAQLAAISVSTPSRNPSQSGLASRTRTPLTASATSSPRPAEPALTVKSEPLEHMTKSSPIDDTPQVSTTTNEDNTVAVA